MIECKGYGGRYCYNETNSASGYCYDCENRKREDAAHAWPHLSEKETAAVERSRKNGGLFIA